MKEYSYCFAAILVFLFVGCKSGNTADEHSILNRDNYTINPSTFVPFIPSNESEIFARNRYDVDMIPIVETFVRPDYSSVDALIDFPIFSYSGDCLILPGINPDRFINCSLLGQRMSYEIINDTQSWKSLILPASGKKESELYGEFVTLHVSNSIFSNDWEDILVTPMAYAFIMEHDYTDGRKAVLVTISYDKEVYHNSAFSAFGPTKKTLTYNRRIICLVDNNTDCIITYNYNKILTDAEPYHTAIIDWGPRMEKPLS